MKIVNCKLKIVRGFALIYVLVIMTIVLISMTQILSLGLADSRQKNKVLATAGAYQMAQSGIEDGIANYNLGKAQDCKPKYYNVAATTNNYNTSARVITPLLTDQGDYQFSICPNYVSAIGYFKGSKLAMRADFLAENKWNIYQVGF